MLIHQAVLILIILIEIKLRRKNHERKSRSVSDISNTTL